MDGCTIYVRECEESLSDEGFSERRGRPLDEEERVHTFNSPGTRPTHALTNINLDVMITLVASAVGVLLRHSCLHLLPSHGCIHLPCDSRTNHAPVS